MTDAKAEQEVKALVFDAYGTLFDVHSVIALCDELFPDQGQALSEIWRTKQLEYTWVLSLMGHYEDFWQVTGKALRYACRALALTCQPSQQDQLMKAYLHLDTYPDVQPGLSALSGYRLSILSNGSPFMLDGAVTSANLMDAFDHLISADEAGIYKPSPLVYQLATQKLGIEAGLIGFVSANAWDIIGASSFGFQTYWVNRPDKPLDELGFTPTRTIDKLTDLAEIFQS